MSITPHCRAGVDQLTRENGEVEQKLQRWKPLDSLFLLKILPFNIGFKRPPSWGKRWRRREVGRSSSIWNSPPGRGSSWCRYWRTSGGRWRIPSLGLYYFLRIEHTLKEETLKRHDGNGVQLTHLSAIESSSSLLSDRQMTGQGLSSTDVTRAATNKATSALDDQLGQKRS